jgi:hypothetical protein
MIKFSQRKAGRQRRKFALKTGATIVHGRRAFKVLRQSAGKSLTQNSGDVKSEKNFPTEGLSQTSEFRFDLIAVFSGRGNRKRRENKWQNS